MAYDEWIGKSKNQSDSLAPEQLQRFEALMNRDPGAVQPGTVLPPCSHWIYFTPLAKQADLSENGHAEKGGFLPPVEQKNRMWGGGTIEFKKPLKVGGQAEKTSTIVKIDEKEGRNGPLSIVTIRHQISSAGSIAIDEEQDLIFRDAGEKGAHPIRTKAMDIDFDWKKTRKPTATELFRFSALTYNAHRIHYDHRYSTEVEGYPNLLVHSPYLLILMMSLFKSNSDGKVIEEINYESVGPVYLGEEITITSKDTDNFKAEMRVLGPDQKIAMKASIKWIYSW